MLPQKQQLKVYLRLAPSTVGLERGFTPVSGAGHVLRQDCSPACRMFAHPPQLDEQTLGDGNYSATGAAGMKGFPSKAS